MRQEELTRRLRARTGIGEDLVAPEDLNDIILGALDEYNARRPCLRMTAAASGIVTVKDQPNYAKPTDALWIVEVCWAPFDMNDDETSGTLEQFLEQVYERSLVNVDHPSEVMAFRQNMSKWAELFRGTWRIVNDEIWLTPVPTTNGDHVAVCYAKANDVEDLDLVKDQMFFNLCKACLKERWGMELVNNAGQAGAYKFPVEAARLILKDARDEHASTLANISRSWQLRKGTSGAFVRSAQ